MRVSSDTNHHMIVFKGKNIRRVLHNDKWWFVVKDIIEALLETSNSTDYIKKMRVRDPALSKGWGPKSGYFSFTG